MLDLFTFADKHLSPYKMVGDEIRVQTCPFCNGGDSEDGYTFSVNVNTGMYQCFRGNCRAKGSIRTLAAKFHEEVYAPHKIVTKATMTYRLPITKPDPITDEIVSYFESRKISRDTLDAFHIGSDSKGNILFPFTINGDLLYVKHRLPRKPGKNDPKEWADPDTRPILFGMDLCEIDQPLVVTEGMIDALSLYEIGIRNVVSVPSGCENLKWVEECWDWLELFNEIVLFGDNDAPGRQMVSNLTKRLGESRCKIVEEYPSYESGRECKDANEILVRMGELQLMDTFDRAKEIPTKGLLNLAKVIPEDPTLISRIKTNIPALDDAIGGLRMGAITVFTGKSGSGKSTITGELLLNAIEQGYNVCAYSCELGAAEFQNWINLQAAGSDYITLKYDPVKNKKVPFVPSNVAQSIMNWYDGHLFLYDNTEIFEKNQSDSILDMFTTAVRKYDCKLFLTDNLMGVTSDTEEETRAQGRFMNALKRFVNKYQVHVIVVAHARKLGMGRRIIEQDDISGNSATVKLAHSAVIVESPNLRVIKSRDSGNMRLIECCYCPDSRRIYQKDAGDLNKFSWNVDNIPMPTIKACNEPEYAVRVGEPDTSQAAF